MRRSLQELNIRSINSDSLGYIPRLVVSRSQEVLESGFGRQRACQRLGSVSYHEQPCSELVFPSFSSPSLETLQVERLVSLNQMPSKPCFYLIYVPILLHDHHIYHPWHISLGLWPHCGSRSSSHAIPITSQNWRQSMAYEAAESNHPPSHFKSYSAPIQQLRYLPCSKAIQSSTALCSNHIGLSLVWICIPRN
jgi:hypothetical protein